MKVLIIYPHGNALSTRAGSETRVWNIVSCLVKNNFDVFILHSINSKGLEDPYLKEKCHVYYYREISILKAPDLYLTDLNPFFVIKLIKLIRKQKFDVIQITNPWGFVMLKLLVRRKTYLIFDSHGVEGEFIKIALKNPMFPMIFKPFAGSFTKLYEKLTCKFTDLIINVSELDREHYIKNYNIKESKAITIQIPSSIKRKEVNNRDILKLKSREKLGLPKEKTIIIFHGAETHLPNKEAFSLIKNFIAPNIKKKDILFVLAGFNLKSWKKANVISLGFVKNLEDLLYSADFAIVPIISGSGQRVKCSDYISLGLPFICTKKGIEGLEFIKNNEDCLIYDTVNNRFLEGILKLYKNKELRKKFHDNLIKKSWNLNQKTFEKRIMKLYSKISG